MNHTPEVSVCVGVALMLVRGGGAGRCAQHAGISSMNGCGRQAHTVTPLRLCRLQVVIVDEIATKEVRLVVLVCAECRLGLHQLVQGLLSSSLQPGKRFSRSHALPAAHTCFFSTFVLQEAAACRTIAQRGVVLVSTAHGSSLADLLRNPDLQGVMGGVKAVTLGDEPAAQSNGGRKVGACLWDGVLFSSNA